MNNVAAIMFAQAPQKNREAKSLCAEIMLEKLKHANERASQKESES